jgi:hypothetical protein
VSVAFRVTFSTRLCLSLEETVAHGQPAGPAERKRSAVSTQPATRLGEVPGGWHRARPAAAVTEAGSDPHRAHRPGRVAPGPAAGAAGGGG